MVRPGKEWRPGKAGGVDKMVAQMIGEAIDAQRDITDYKGDDAGWERHVADRAWDAETYRIIGYNGGYIASLLNLAEYSDVHVAPALVERGKLYVYLLYG